MGKPFPYPLGPGRTGEIAITREDGTSRVADVRSAEIEWKGDDAVLATMRDVTSQKRMDQLLRDIKERQRMDQLKDDLINGVSHQMRTPLTIISAAVSSLREGLAGPLSEKQLELASMASTSARRLMKIMNNLLDLAWLESGKTAVQRRRVDAVRAIRESLGGIRLLAEPTETHAYPLPDVLERLREHRLQLVADPPRVGDLDRPCGVVDARQEADEQRAEDMLHLVPTGVGAPGSQPSPRTLPVIAAERAGACRAHTPSSARARR